jgi:hypothetical protein
MGGEGSASWAANFFLLGFRRLSGRSTSDSPAGTGPPPSATATRSHSWFRAKGFPAPGKIPRATNKSPKLPAPGQEATHPTPQRNQYVREYFHPAPHLGQDGMHDLDQGPRVAFQPPSTRLAMDLISTTLPWDGTYWKSAEMSRKLAQFQRAQQHKCHRRQMLA